MARLAANSYGKNAVRLTKVVRRGEAHSVFEFAIDILLEGGFDEVYTEGNNAACVPTDTMKNTVYALARTHAFESPEEFAMLLARHFIETFAHVSAAEVRIEQAHWDRIKAGGKAHDHAFVKGCDARRTAHVRQERGGVSLLEGGVTGLEIMKTAQSGFVGFLRDEYTALKETTERIFGTSVQATWRFTEQTGDFNGDFAVARRTILEVFAGHDSRGVQHTLFEMGRQLLANMPAISRVDLVMPNQHRLLANLSPLGLDNDNEIFVNTTEPYGLINGTITREEP